MGSRTLFVVVAILTLSGLPVPRHLVPQKPGQGRLLGLKKDLTGKVWGWESEAADGKIATVTTGTWKTLQGRHLGVSVLAANWK